MLDFLTIHKIWHLCDTSLVNNTWHAVIFPILFRNLMFTWDFLGHDQWYKACQYISYTIQKFDIYMRFPWSRSMIHGMPLYFLHYSEIWRFLWSTTRSMLLHFYAIQKFDVYLRFPSWMTHGMPLYFFQWIMWCSLYVICSVCQQM